MGWEKFDASNDVGSRFSKNVKASIEAGELVVTEVDDSMLPSFDAEEDMKDHVAALKHWEKEIHAQAKERYNKLSMVML